MLMPTPKFLPRLMLVALLACPLWAGAARLLIFGEQHDQPDQQRQVADEVQDLAAQGRLAAVVLEMAEAPHNTAALPREATPEQVRAALSWRGWPWDAYAAVVMNAVRAGVPVWGGNLPRDAMRATMRDTSLDARVDDATRTALAEAVRSGHCNLLPATQEPGMVRIQVARDLSMARTIDRVAAGAAPDTTVLLLTGAQHASRERGVPLHLLAAGGWLPHEVRIVMFGKPDDGLQADERRSAVVTPQQDHCEGLRQRLSAGSAGAASAPSSAASAASR